MHVAHVHVAHVHVQRPEESTVSLRAGVTNVCQACYMDAGVPMLVLMIGQQSALKHLSSPNDYTLVTTIQKEGFSRRVCLQTIDL